MDMHAWRLAVAVSRLGASGPALTVGWHRRLCAVAVSRLGGLGLLSPSVCTDGYALLPFHGWALLDPFSPSPYTNRCVMLREAAQTQLAQPRSGVNAAVKRRQLSREAAATQP
jgi:hypothetical protein